MANQEKLTPVNISIELGLKDISAAIVYAAQDEVKIHPIRNYIGIKSFQDFGDAAKELDGLDQDTLGDKNAVLLPAFVIDLKKYYPENCPLELIAVGSKFDDRSFATIICDETKLVYGSNLIAAENGRGWSQKGVTDKFWYTVRIKDTNNFATALIEISRLEEEHALEDIYIELEPTTTGIIDIDLLKFNPDLANGKITGFGIHNPTLIRDIRISPDNEKHILVKLSSECGCWECDYTDFAVDALVNDSESGKQLKSRFYVNLIEACENFLANLIEIDIAGEVPAYIDIDVSVYNSHALVELLQVLGARSERGGVTYSPFINIVRYTFNRISGYWNSSPVEDMLMYNIRNKANGQKAKSYIIIKRRDSSSSSGPALHYSTDYTILPDSALLKAAKGPYDPYMIPDPETLIVFLEGTILTNDHEDNRISLPAHLEIKVVDGSFTGKISGIDAKGIFTVHPPMPVLLASEFGTKFSPVGGQFKLLE